MQHMRLCAGGALPLLLVSDSKGPLGYVVFRIGFAGFAAPTGSVVQL